MSDATHRYLVTRATLLRDLIPTKLSRRDALDETAIDGQCRDLQRQARQLYQYARTPAERKFVDDLVAEIDNRRMTFASNAESLRRETMATLQDLQEWLRTYR